MSQFNFAQYQAVIEKAKANENSNNIKVGFFKLKDDGEEALVRFNISSVDDLQFSTTHQLGAAYKYMKISCLAPLGSTKTSLCPLCEKAENDSSIGKAAKKVYVQMLVAYKDPTTGGFSAAIPVVWERPAGFSREIAGLIRDYGDLHEHVLKITRNGKAGDRSTTYSVSYIPMYDKPELVTNDFGAFANFNLARHSFWVKTAEEIAEFIKTGSFPTAATTNKAAVQAEFKAAPKAVEQEAVKPVEIPGSVTPATVAINTSVEETKAETVDNTIDTGKPARKFSGFVF